MIKIIIEMPTAPKSYCKLCDSIHGAEEGCREDEGMILDNDVQEYEKRMELLKRSSKWTRRDDK